jgi:WhiB family redox-sensing transcriptional regulator
LSTNVRIFFWEVYFEIDKPLVLISYRAIQTSAGVVPVRMVRAGHHMLDRSHGGGGLMTRARMPRPHEVAIARRDPRLLEAIQELRTDEAWRTRGACRSVDPETFFPAPNEPSESAVALCGTCEVRGPCLAWALQVGDCHGVWGGTTPRERRAMLVAWRERVGPDGVAVDDEPDEEERRLLTLVPLSR